MFDNCETISDGTLDEFLFRCYRKDRFQERGQEYMQVCIESHRADLQKDGYTILSRHESNTGAVIVFRGDHA